MAVQETWFVAERTLSYLVGVIAGRESADQLGGPIRVAEVSAQVATLGFVALVNLAAILDDADLAARLSLDGLADEANGIDVLDFAARAERLARPAHGHVHVGAQVALLHVAVARAEIAQDRTQLGHVRLRFLRRAQIRPRHDLHERHAGAVQIDVRIVGVLVLDRLAGVLLPMQALDADCLRLTVDVDARRLVAAADRQVRCRADAPDTRQDRQPLEHPIIVVRNRGSVRISRLRKGHRQRENTVGVEARVHRP